ncbi:hypothetical protein [Synechocystis sp. PCC 7509]|uniref:hypothetical protein n=1 Tax=Synechocystis sp. PCC 7509 TaxID=927677 RepID=UPI0002ABA34D|nr:hypothetical protein [Synechocystis sp. PCC 7509]
MIAKQLFVTPKLLLKLIYFNYLTNGLKPNNISLNLITHTFCRLLLLGLPSTLQRSSLAITLLLIFTSLSLTKPAFGQTSLAYSILKTSELPPIDNQIQLAETPIDFSPVLANLELIIPADPTIKPSIRLENTTPTPQDSEYIITPRVVPDNKINPFTTALPLNGISISHLTQWEALGGYNFGENQNDSFIVDGIVRLESSVTESLTRNNVLTIDQKGTYAQLRTVRQFREVDVTRFDPQTLIGLQIQLSLTAACIGETASTSQQCTYTPGLVTDRNSIDPQFLVPTRINQTANVFDIVTPESLAIIERPGFQSGANGQQIGIDLYFPNVGAFPGNTQSDRTRIERRETLEDTPALTISGVRQIIKANDSEAVIARTIRGWTGILEDDNTGLNSLWQLGAYLLPDVEPQLDGGVNPVNSNINKNLFLAANNTRVPLNSFTAYQAGIGRSPTPKVPPTDLRELPSVNYNSLWVGLSPITERTFSRSVRYNVTGLPRILAAAGGEGGVNSNVAFVSVVNNQGFSTDEFQDFYTQIYLTFLNQNADFVSSTRLTEKTTYYPHISFTGNITGSEDVLRYYAGVIPANRTKAYLGLDYTKNTSNGWTFNTGAIGYLNPDRDYYSQLVGNLAKRIAINKNANVILSTAFNYALDRETMIGSTVIISPASYVTLGARANVGRVSFGLTNYFGDLLPESIDDTLLANLDLRISKNLVLSAYLTPINNNSSRSRYGASANLRLGKSYNSPSLIFRWTNNEYDFGNDPVGRELLTTDNVFSVVFKLGQPSNPFDVETAEKIRQQTEQEVQRLRESNQDQDLLPPPFQAPVP